MFVYFSQNNGHRIIVANRKMFGWCVNYTLAGFWIVYSYGPEQFLKIILLKGYYLDIHPKCSKSRPMPHLPAPNLHSPLYLLTHLLHPFLFWTLVAIFPPLFLSQGSWRVSALGANKRGISQGVVHVSRLNLEQHCKKMCPQDIVLHCYSRILDVYAFVGSLSILLASVLATTFIHFLVFIQRAERL